MAESVNLVRARANSGARVEADDLLFAFDCTISITTNDAGTLTQLPVEVEGSAAANVADHYQNNPLSLVLSGLVTDTPPVVEGVAPLPNRALGMLDELREMKRRGQPVSLITNGRGVFENMVITSVSETQTLAQGHAVVPTVTLQQVTFVGSAVTFIPPLASAARGRRSSDVVEDNGTSDAASGIDNRGSTTTVEESVPPGVRLFGGLFGVS